MANYITSSSKTWWRETKRAGWRGQINLTNLIRLIWVSVVYWAEIRSFTSAVRRCSWENWEKWPAGATPSHAILIADPQLVDPHTYVRSKPNMAATMYYIDRYLARVYRDILSGLSPSTVIFLGDLFDGGREWDTEVTMAKPGGNGRGEEAHMNDAYWHQEFERFQRIFPSEPGVLTIKSVPGNHDLGFGKGIRPAVLERFKTYFGETNSVWEVGNHSFVLVDSVSMSDDRQSDDGWQVGGKAKEWLDEYSKGLHQPVPRTTVPRKLMSQQVQLASETDKENPNEPPPQQNLFDRRLPTILLTHVPLYRGPNEPCGPLRESKRHGGGIPFRAGYQYSNVLSHELSRDLLRKISPTWVFSGDDHDYCVFEHAGVGDPGKGLRTGRMGIIKEITVKSISWCMGIRKPGIQLVSLWNPSEKEVDPQVLVKNLGNNLKLKHDDQLEETEYGLNAQTHLCILPDQLGIFVFYAGLFAWTLIFLSIKATRFSSASSHVHGQHPSLFISPEKANFIANKEPLLPLATPTPTTATFSHHQHQPIPNNNGTTTSTLAPSSASQKPRSSSNNLSPSDSRSSSPRGGYGYHSGRHELETPPLEDNYDEKDKYRKASDPNVFNGVNNWISSHPISSAAGDAATKTSVEAKKWLSEKGFIFQKVLQSNAVGRQIVRLWRKGPGRLSGNGWVARKMRNARRISREVSIDALNIAVIVLPLYIYLVIKY